MRNSIVTSSPERRTIFKNGEHGGTVLRCSPRNSRNARSSTNWLSDTWVEIVITFWNFSINPNQNRCGACETIKQAFSPRQLTLGREMWWTRSPVSGPDSTPFPNTCSNLTSCLATKNSTPDSSNFFELTKSTPARAAPSVFPGRVGCPFTPMCSVKVASWPTIGSTHSPPFCLVSWHYGGTSKSRSVSTSSTLPYGECSTLCQKGKQIYRDGEYKIG